MTMPHTKKISLENTLSQEVLALIEQTSHLSNWKGTTLTPEQSKVRNVFLYMMAHHPSSCFKEFAHHPFWVNWRSKSSKDQNGCVLYACAHSCDHLWLEKLLSVCQAQPTVEHMLKSAINNKSPSMLPFIVDLARRQGHALDQLDDIFLKIPKSSPQKALLSLLDMGLFPQRLFGLECHVVARNSIKSRYDRQEVLEKMWSLWGKPAPSQYSQLLRITMQKASRCPDLKFENFMLSCYNPSSSFWNEEDDLSLLTGWVPKRLATLEEKLAQEWSLSKNAWDKFLLSPPKLTDQQMNACIKLRLNVELYENKQKAPASLRKKI